MRLNPDADTFAFFGDVDNSLVINQTSGKIGIGLASPEAIGLHIQKASTDTSIDLDDKVKYKTELLAASQVFGILKKSPKKWLGIGQTQDNLNSEFIENLINERNEARLSKDFNKADEIRNKLSDMGIEIEDTPKGTIWRSK